MNFADMWQTWIKATTSPNDATFEELRRKSDANVTTAIIWMAFYGAVSAVAGVISGLMFAGAMSTTVPAILEQANLSPAEAAQIEPILNTLTGGGAMGAAGLASLANIITVPLFFLISVGIYFLIARVLGGSGDFGRYAYLNAAFAAPLGILTTLLGMVPFVGCITPLISLYSLVLVYFATKTEHQMSSGRAIWVVLLPVLVAIGLMMCLILGVFGLVASLQNQ